MGYGAAMTSPVPALTPGHDGKLSPYKFDLDKAKALMKEAGVSTPVTLDLAVRIGWQPHEEAAVWIQRELEKIGFKINITRQTDATFRQLASKGDLQLSIEILAVVGERSVLPHGAAVPQRRRRAPTRRSTTTRRSTRSSTRTTTSPTPRSAWPPPRKPRRSSSTTPSGACCGTTTGRASCASDLVGIEKRWDTFERFNAMKTG